MNTSEKNTTNIRKHNQGNLSKNKNTEIEIVEKKIKIRESVQKIQHPINSRKRVEKIKERKIKDIISENIPELSDISFSPGEGNGNPLQYSCPEKPMERGAWWATAHEIAKSQTRLSNTHTRTHSHSHTHSYQVQTSGNRLWLLKDNHNIPLSLRKDEIINIYI